MEFLKNFKNLGDLKFFLKTLVIFVRNHRFRGSLREDCQCCDESVDLQLRKVKWQLVSAGCNRLRKRTVHMCTCAVHSNVNMCCRYSSDWVVRMFLLWAPDPSTVDPVLDKGRMYESVKYKGRVLEERIWRIWLRRLSTETQSRRQF